MIFESKIMTARRYKSICIIDSVDSTLSMLFLDYNVKSTKLSERTVWTAVGDLARFTADMDV